MEENKNFMDKVKEFLQSFEAMFICLVMVLAFSTPNTVEVLVRLNRIAYLNEVGSRILAFNFAIVIEAVILVLAARGQSQAAKYYAWCSFALHLIYYHRWEELLIYENWQNPVIAQRMITDLISSLLVSGMISRSIYYFSEQMKIIIDQWKKEKGLPDIQQQLSEAEQKLSDVNQKISDKERTLSELEQKQLDIEQQFSLKQKLITTSDRLISEKENAVSELEQRVTFYEEKIESIKKAKSKLKANVTDPTIKSMLDEIDV